MSARITRATKKAMAPLGKNFVSSNVVVGGAGRALSVPVSGTAIGERVSMIFVLCNKAIGATRQRS